MSNQLIASTSNYTPEQVDLIKRTICKGATDDELQMFMYQCNKVQLDPFSRQIWSIERKSKNDKGQWEATRTCQVSIDGLRLIAERSGKYEGQTAPQWCGSDGKWVDVWTQIEPPIAARVGIHKTGFKEPLYAIARFSSYAQRKTDGTPTRFWNTMPDLMLSKCAESLALRKAFPLELSGIYTPDEMGSAELIVENPKITIKEKDSIKIGKLSESILESSTLESLKSSFQDAVKYARSFKDTELENIFISYKDNRKNELELISSQTTTGEM